MCGSGQECSCRLLVHWRHQKATALGRLHDGQVSTLPSSVCFTLMPACTSPLLFQGKRIKVKLFSDCTGSLLRRQPGRTFGHTTHQNVDTFIKHGDRVAAGETMRTEEVAKRAKGGLKQASGLGGVPIGWGWSMRWGSHQTQADGGATTGVYIARLLWAPHCCRCHGLHSIEEAKASLYWRKGLSSSFAHADDGLPFVMLA